MEDIKTDINKISKDIKEINIKLIKLSEHIDFIERTYTMVRSPLAYICNKLSANVNKEQPLPEIKDSNNKIE